MSRYLSNPDAALYFSKAADGDWKYPVPLLHKEDYLLVSEEPLHKIYWAEYGNPQGEPVMFLHGGPGGATQPNYARFFDPKRYRIILFDQRGCGKSQPSAADDCAAALQDNTTQHLIEDVKKLRQARGITGKMHVFGGSWGSSLGMAYAIAHPDNVESLVMRGISLNRKEDFDYFYQGNAAQYHENPYDIRFPGTYMFYPEAWKTLVEIVPIEKRGDMIKAYAEIFSRTPQTSEEQTYLNRAVMAWTEWEGITSYISQDESKLGKFGDLRFARAFARLENHYFMNGAFLGGSGEANRDNNWLLDNAHKIAHLPIYIVQGQFDQVCPRFQADALVAALEKVGAGDNVHRVFTPAGHSALERETVRALTAFMDEMPRMRLEQRPTSIPSSTPPQDIRS